LKTENANPRKNPELQGAHILKSYLKSLKIPFEIGGSENSVEVKTVDGQKTVSVVVGSGSGQIQIDPLIITSFELSKSLSALHLVTEAAGYGRPNPISRGAQSTGRVNYLDNFEDVYLRHSIFRRSPNQNDADLEPFLPTIKRCARKAMFRYKNVFQAMGFSEGDLITTGMVYTVSYLHHYSYAPDHIDNVKLLTDFLKQRFGEMAKITYKKALNATCLPQAVRANALNHEDEETSYIDTYAESEESSPDDEYGEDEFRVTFAGGIVRTLIVKNDGMLGLDLYLDGRKLRPSEARSLTEDMRQGRVKKERVHDVLPEPEESEASMQARALAARKELIEKLRAMDTETRTVVLGYAALSRDYAPDARREARNLCEELVCPQCERKVPSGAYCLRCEVGVVPLLGVDYMAFREKLEKEHHPMAEAMSAHVPESEIRARAKKPVVQTTVSLADATEAKPIEIVKVVPIISAIDREALKKQLEDDLLKRLPATGTCPFCKRVLPQKDFGVRVANDKTTGLPSRASRQSRCHPCRGKKAKKG